LDIEQEKEELIVDETTFSTSDQPETEAVSAIPGDDDVPAAPEPAENEKTITDVLTLFGQLFKAIGK